MNSTADTPVSATFPDANSPVLLTRSEVKEILKCSARTVDRLRERGQLPFVQVPGSRLVRYRPEAVAALVATSEHRQPTNGPALVAHILATRVPNPFGRTAAA